MHDRPEKAPDAEGEEKEESEEPGKAELDRRNEGADKAQDEPENSEQPADEREAVEAAALKKFAFRRGHDVRSIAHFFSGSAAGAGSGVFSISARCCGGMSAATARWLRCNARR